MKKIFLIIFIVPFLVGCSSTVEDRIINICGESYYYSELQYTDVDEICGQYYNSIVQDTIDDFDYVDYCEDHEIKDHTECLESFRDDISEDIYDKLN